ncbi:MAG: hypothetical protein IJK01_06290 [Clostridia bacterium]|nr:hypothetical protein [Clostridia bacterium]
MRIILDTEEKTITVPWNYAKKLDEINKIIVEVTGDENKKKTFASYLQENWDACMKDTDKHLVVGPKPVKKKD